MKRYRIITSVFFLLLLWELLALSMQNDFILPYPMDVLEMMKQQLMERTFYQHVGYTLIRSLSGLLIAFALAFSCAYISYRSKRFYDLFYPVLLLTRSIPNICYTILILIWFGRERSSMIVSFMILFPTIFSSIYSGFLHVEKNLLRVITLYPESQWYLLRSIYLPLLKGSMEASLSNGISLAFKVGVMAEIVGQVQVGIGRQLNLCRLNLDVTGIFAWTGWIIIVLLFLEFLLRIIYMNRSSTTP